MQQQWTPQVRRVNPNEPEQLQHAASLLREKRIEEARDELLNILTQNDKSVRAHLMLGALYQGQRMYGEALDHYRYALGIDPMHAAANQRAGTCCLRLNEFDEAGQLLQTALDLEPDNIPARMGMAQVLLRGGDVEGALRHLEHVLRLDPQMAQARFLMARLLSQSGKADEALDELTGLHNTNPRRTGAAIGMARIEGQRGNTDRAVELLEAAAQTNPDAPNVWSMLGRQKMSQQDYAAAESAFREAIRLQPQNEIGQLSLVAALLPQGKLADAIDVLGKLPRRGRLATPVHRLYGDIYAAQEMYGDAIRSYRAALLHSEKGKQLTEAVEKSLPPDAEQEAEMAAYQAACMQLREQMRERSKQRSQPGELRGVARRRRAAGGAGAGRFPNP